jgi:hypothetical protein
MVQPAQNRRRDDATTFGEVMADRRVVPFGTAR